MSTQPGTARNRGAAEADVRVRRTCVHHAGGVRGRGCDGGHAAQDDRRVARTPLAIGVAPHPRLRHREIHL